MVHRGREPEFGHITFDVNGRRCECGNQGCLEAYVSDHGIFRTYSELFSSLLEVDPIEPGVSAIDYLFTRALQGDTRASEALTLTGTYLGIGLATLVNLFNPSCIIITNGVGYHVDPLLKSMSDLINQHIFSQLGDNLKVIIEDNSTLINWARGAGCLVLQDFFSSPV